MKEILTSLRENPGRVYFLIFIMMILGGISLYFLAEGSYRIILIIVLGMILLGNLLVILI